MIIEGNELSLFDLISYYANRNQCSCLYFNLDKYNNLAADKKATVTAYYEGFVDEYIVCLLYTSPSPRDRTSSRMPSSA